MGDVYLGRDERLNRDIAVKVLRADWRGHDAVTRRFVEEARIASQLQHPGIPPVHACGALPDGRPYFVMKVVAGRTLADLLKERTEKPTDLPRFLAIFQQVCQAVAYAHSQGILHRDLKPLNVMVGAFGEVQVMDWGLAKVLTRPEATTEQDVAAAGDVVTSEGDLRTRHGFALGTPAYMPPEQARGEVAHQDRRCDVFGLGAILCEILTGKPPYEGTPGEVLDQARAGASRSAAARLDQCGADAEVVQLARTCLNGEPDARPTDAGAVARAVATYQTGVQERLRKAELDAAAAATERRMQRKVVRLVVTAATLKEPAPSK